MAQATLSTIKGWWILLPGVTRLRWRSGARISRRGMKSDVAATRLQGALQSPAAGSALLAATLQSIRNSATRPQDGAL